MELNIEKRDQFCTKLLTGDITLDDIQNKILHILSLIEKKTSFNDVNEYFVELSEIQFAIAYLYFTNCIKVNDFIYNFIRDFDRLDVEFERNDLFLKIKNGEYLNYTHNNN